MITRNRLKLLAAAAVVLFALSALTRNQTHGVGGAIGFVLWWAFVLTVLVLVVTSIATLIHHRRQT